MSFQVKKTDAKHPDFRRAAGRFEHAIDELYQNSMMLPGSVVLATAYSDPKKPRGTGKDEPVIWVSRYGKGRVYENVLGHDSKALADPNYQDWLRRGVIWAATGSRLTGLSVVRCWEDGGATLRGYAMAFRSGTLHVQRTTDN